MPKRNNSTGIRSHCPLGGAGVDGAPKRSVSRPRGVALEGAASKDRTVMALYLRYCAYCVCRLDILICAILG